MGKQAIVFALIFIAALGIRLYRINEPPLSFHATRQYRSLLIARGFYYQGLQGLPEWKKEVTRINQQRQGLLEPPVIELLTAAGYRMVGGEYFWFPRLLSILFWLVGGGFVYLIGEKIANAKAALFATAFYLFLPFSIQASRSFQPDPLMVLLLLSSVYACLRYDEQPSTSRLIVVYILSACAIFIKPVSLFVIYTVFGTLAFNRQGFRKAVSNPAIFVFFLVTPLPALLFYLYGILTSETLQTQAQASFLPQLLLNPFYWRGWLENINAVIGFIAFLGALLGLMMVPKDRPLILLFAMWAGYILFCLVFNYHIATHDYYHLQLIPIAALSLSPLVMAIAERLEDNNREWYRQMAIRFILLLAFVIYAAVTVRNLAAAPNNVTSVGVAEEIGSRIKHSTRTVYLASDYGLSLEYHGEISGLPWPLVSDLQWESLANQEILDAEDRFQAWFYPEEPEYFIITDLREFEEQKDLAHFLRANYPLLVRSDSYQIYSLQQK